jgi:AbrB family looped-hinge helix DNA binding protein
MPIYSSSVSPKGQVTIPQEIRQKFDIRTRDQVEFRIVDGTITLVPSLSKIRELYGSLGPPPQSDLSWKEREELAKEEWVEKYIAKDRMSRGLED